MIEMVRKRTGKVHLVMDARDLLLDRRALLGWMCAAIGAPIHESMVSWSPRRRPTDGVRAKRW